MMGAGRKPRNIVPSTSQATARIPSAPAKPGPPPSSGALSGEAVVAYRLAG